MLTRAGIVPLKIREVQSGSYLGEDDLSGLKILMGGSVKKEWGTCKI